MGCFEPLKGRGNQAQVPTYVVTQRQSKEIIPGDSEGDSEKPGSLAQFEGASGRSCQC